jgi:hypothetical protein
MTALPVPADQLTAGNPEKAASFLRPTKARNHTILNGRISRIQ